MLTATLVPVEPVSCVNDTDVNETGKVNVVVVVDVVVMACWTVKVEAVELKVYVSLMDAAVIGSVYATFSTLLPVSVQVLAIRSCVNIRLSITRAAWAAR